MNLRPRRFHVFLLLQSCCLVALVTADGLEDFRCRDGQVYTVSFPLESMSGNEFGRAADSVEWTWEPGEGLCDIVVDGDVMVTFERLRTPSDDSVPKTLQDDGRDQEVVLGQRWRGDDNLVDWYHVSGSFDTRCDSNSYLSGDDCVRPLEETYDWTERKWKPVFKFPLDGEDGSSSRENVIRLSMDGQDASLTLVFAPFLSSFDSDLYDHSHDCWEEYDEYGRITSYDVPIDLKCDGVPNCLYFDGFYQDEIGDDCIQALTGGEDSSGSSFSQNFNAWLSYALVFPFTLVLVVAYAYCAVNSSPSAMLWLDLFSFLALFVGVIACATVAAVSDNKNSRSVCLALTITCAILLLAIVPKMYKHVKNRRGGGGGGGGDDSNVFAPQGDDAGRRETWRDGTVASVDGGRTADGVKADEPPSYTEAVDGGGGIGDAVDRY